MRSWHRQNSPFGSWHTLRGDFDPASLLGPASLFTEAQATFTNTSHMNLASNWTAAPSDLRQIVGNASTSGVRLTMDVPVVPGRPHFIQSTFLSGGGAGTLRQRFGGAGVSPSAQGLTTEDRPLFQWNPASEVTGAYSFVELLPSSDAYAQQITRVDAWDLSATNPLTVACDVVLCLGDSNMSNAVSDFVSLSNIETPFDSRVWYMPCLRASPAFANTMSARHIPQPSSEPVQSAAGAFRMSPLMAFGARFAPWSAARGRPLLLLSLGDPGSGLRNTEDWVKDSVVATTGARMWDEMVLMIAAMNALGPTHQIVGAIVSLGANDLTGTVYDAWIAAATKFVADLRSEVSLPNLPIAWTQCGADYELGSFPDYIANATPLAFRVGRMRAAQASLDANAGAPNAIAGVKTVAIPGGMALGAPTPDAGGFVPEVHYSAAGMQRNGRLMADALIAAINDV